MKNLSKLGTIKTGLGFQVLYTEDEWPTYDAWLWAHGRACAVFGKFITSNRYSTWNRKETNFFSRISLTLQLSIQVCLMISM